ncbi:hypothetical protein BU23DRAFT_558979 [Bimuria novae-zelandiae CBS 107.79]|uniref:Nephrocystin 3-like N-terminal domain-containing protein n=1 Tax=Bimuria novae-zelandiae CBS 107.79 TaxID=1447943 RepID=A0A6A5UT08_9PLEO|nr:hypothetical protein BU23DRAFT_558979 [Bimuria novae-zelandiae CBS 107.79]
MASTTSTIAFGDARSSVQAHTINGSVEFHLQPELENSLGRLPHATDAPFNSYAAQHERVCLPDTRVDLLREIHSWAGGPDERCIFWLRGLAGTGKSTIAQTVARSYYPPHGQNLPYTGHIEMANRSFAPTSDEHQRRSDLYVDLYGDLISCGFLMKLLDN